MHTRDISLQVHTKGPFVISNAHPATSLQLPGIETDTGRRRADVAVAWMAHTTCGGSVSQGLTTDRLRHEARLAEDAAATIPPADLSLWVPCMYVHFAVANSQRQLHILSIMFEKEE